VLVPPREKNNRILLLVSCSGLFFTSTYYARHEEHNQPTSAVPCTNQAPLVQITKQKVLYWPASEMAKLHLGFTQFCKKDVGPLVCGSSLAQEKIISTKYQVVSYTDD
jgi:hypothetical protein